MKQPDFGSTFVLYSLLFVMLFYAGLKTKHIAIGLGFLVPLCAWAVFSAPYRVKRILGFLNPWENMSREGFQIVQSFLAFQNGGLFGVGLGNSKQKLFYLPEAHTDFILSIIAEEVGSIGIFIVLALYSYIIYLGYLISQRAQNYYYKTLAFGITTLLGLQSILNMGVALGMLPTKGMTLPFISSGTSSLVTCLVAVGLLARIGHKTKEEKNEFR